MSTIKVTNRSDGNVVYVLEELRTRRVFNINESKEIEEAELEALWQTDGGQVLIKESLLVHDKEWVKAHWDAPIEYFWTNEDIKKCLLKDDIELFTETLDYAPTGVVDLIKAFAWRLPITDLNKIGAIREKTGFDVMLAIEAMSSTVKKSETTTPTTRRRREEV